MDHGCLHEKVIAAKLLPIITELAKFSHIKFVCNDCNFIIINKCLIMLNKDTGTQFVMLKAFLSQFTPFYQDFITKFKHTHGAPHKIMDDWHQTLAN